MVSMKNAPVSQAGATLGLTQLATTPNEDDEAQRRRLQQQKLERPQLPATNALFGQ